MDHQLNIKESGWRVVKVSASRSRGRGFEYYIGSRYDSSNGTSTGWFQEADSRAIYLCCENLFHNRANIFKLKIKIYNLTPLKRLKDMRLYICIHFYESFVHGS